jgi:hypothetical protein
MDALTSAQIVLNDAANTLGVVLAPIGRLPGWLSATLIGVLTGIGMLVAFKYTSNQKALKRVRRGIRADLLAVRLFPDNLWGGLKAQGRVLLGAVKLLLLAVVPVLAMTVPMVLLLAQMGLWFQAGPVPVGRETVVTVALADSLKDPREVQLLPSEAVEDLSGPVWVASKREMCWEVRARQPGYHRLQLRVGGQTVEKELAVGEGMMRVSPKRPGRVWSDLVRNPAEPPFAADAAVRSVEVEYPPRSSWTSGTDRWVIYWLGVSLVAGFCFRGMLNVSL